MRDLFLVSWLFGTAAFFLIGVFFGFRLILIKKKWSGVIFILAGIIALIFNPIVNLVTTDNFNHRCCEAALENAKLGDYVGAQSEVIRKQFGPPYRIQTGAGVEYWAYRTSPWFVFKPDEFLGFEMREGKVANLYIEVD